MTLLGATQSADGYLWRQVRFGTQDGWAASQYLVFAPLGTPPTPPSSPVSLRQLLAVGGTSIPPGGTVNSASVVLAGSTGGTSDQQVTVQFEVRPSGTIFSAPTHDTGLVRGGTEACVKVSGLSNRGYHWRARVLDGNGVASAWVPFSAGVTDFAINAALLHSALFHWTPAQVFTGDSVQFTAQAADESGLTFNWDFGGGQTATGPTATRTLTQPGKVTVTLAVTDAQGHQSQHAETVTVATKQLQDAINNLAQRTSASLEQTLSQAQQVAGAADYFQRGVDIAPSQIALSAVFDAIGLGTSAAEFKDLIKTSLGDAAVDSVADVHTELVSWASDWVFTKGFKSGRSYADIFVPNLTAFITQKKAEIEQLRQQALGAVGSLTPAQQDQLVRNLQARSSGNITLSSSYANKAHLPVTFADLKATDEDSWSFMVGEHLFDASVGLGLIAVGDGFDGFAAVMLTVSSAAGMGTLDKLNILAGQSTDAQMLGLSVDVVAQGTFVAKQMTANAENGLHAVRDAQVPSTPAGQMTVEPVTQGRLQQFAFARRWFAKSACANVTVRNTGPTAATYRVEAVYPSTFTTTQLLPFRTYGIGERNYDIAVICFVDGIQLGPGEQRIVALNYLSSAGGQIPDGPIYYTLTARTSDGSYLMDSETGQFGTTFIDENGNVIDHSQLQDVLLTVTPVRSTLVQFSGSTLCNLAISVRNPLETPLVLNLQQALPPRTTVIEAGSGTPGTNQLVWEVDLLPGESRSFQATLQLPQPVGQPSLPSIMLSAYDPLNGNWLQFQPVPATSQVVELPAPELLASGLTSNGFGVDLWAFIPGIYRVEATRDFAAWEPLLTVTNAASIIHIIDHSAQSHPARFYRALRQ